MDNPPRDPKLDIVTNKSWIAIILYAFTMTAAVVLAVGYAKFGFNTNDRSIANDQLANNVGFITLSFAQLFHVFNMSSVKSKFFVNDITKNKWVWLALLACTVLLGAVYAIPQLRTTLNLVQVPAQLWFVCVGAGFVPVIVIQIYKAISKQRSSSVN
jgi:Ca2+-transporting ATPase